MLNTNEERLVFLLCIVSSLFVLVVDVYLHAFMANATISRIWQSVWERYPTAALVFVFWIGLLVGHLLPTR
jgi:hypothetical protein